MPKLTLETLAEYPIVTYVFGFTGRSKLDEAFSHRGLTPKVVFTAADADVIKTYVRLGLGVGIVAEMALKDDGTNSDLVAIPAGPLFGINVARVAFKRSAYLRNFVYKFAELLSDKLNRDLITKAMAGRLNDYEA